MAELLIIGHCTIDTIHLADGTELSETFGGAAAYASVGAAITGADVVLVSRVGADYPLSRLANGLSSSGRVDAGHVRVCAERSIRNDAWYSSDGSRRWEIESWRTLEALMPEPADVPSLRRLGAALIAPALTAQQSALVETCALLGPVALDTEVHYLSRERERSELLELVGKVDYFLPSIEHLNALFADESREPLEYAGRLAAFGARIVAVKHGLSGSTVMDFLSGCAWCVPAVPRVDAKDTTGAGDGYDGGLLAALAGGASLPSAACWGAVAASFVVETVGASAPDRFDPREAARRFRELRPQVIERPLCPSQAEKEPAAS